jgi:hypothetical protein
MARHANRSIATDDMLKIAEVTHNDRVASPDLNNALGRIILYIGALEKVLDQHNCWADLDTSYLEVFDPELKGD